MISDSHKKSTAVVDYRPQYGSWTMYFRKLPTVVDNSVELLLKVNLSEVNLLSVPSCNNPVKLLYKKSFSVTCAYFAVLDKRNFTIEPEAS